MKINQILGNFYPYIVCKGKMNKTTNQIRETITMRQLILKGLGKAKVKRIVKAFVLNDFNQFLDYGSQVFELHKGAIVNGFGLPAMNDDEEFTLDELLDFLGNKI